MAVNIYTEKQTNKQIQWKLPFFYWIPIFIIKEEDCQNIWQKKNSNMNDRQCKDSLAFFLSECELHLTGHLNFWVKESSFLIFTSVCVFTDFLRSAWRLKKNILTGSSIRQDLKGKKNHKKKSPSLWIQQEHWFGKTKSLLSCLHFFFFN